MTPLPEHVLLRPLGPADLDKVVKLEAKTTPARECAGLDRIRYWLQVAPELSAGMFVRIPPRQAKSCRKVSTSSSQRRGSTSSTSSAKSNSSNCSSDGPGSGNVFRRISESHLLGAEEEPSGECCDVVACPRSREKLIAFIIGSKFVGEEISDGALSVPICGNNEKSTKLRHHLCKSSSSESVIEDEKIGHLEYGDKVVIQTFAVDPDYQGMKLGTTIFRDYIQRLSTQAVAQQIAMLAHSYMVPFYESLGFYDSGCTQMTIGGANDWHNIWISLDNDDD